jgi:hypothetical protein
MLLIQDRAANAKLVTSVVVQDFYNLVDVYLDAVLYPRCISDKRTFEQEGWHLELDQVSDPLTYKGVVFNEMKGVYSSPDSVFYRVVQQVKPEETAQQRQQPAQQPANACLSWQASWTCICAMCRQVVWCVQGHHQLFCW